MSDLERQLLFIKSLLTKQRGTGLSIKPNPHSEMTGFLQGLLAVERTLAKLVWLEVNHTTFIVRVGEGNQGELPLSRIGDATVLDPRKKKPHWLHAVGT